MRKKIYIALLCTLLFASGCDVQYTVEMKDQNFYEKIELSGEQNAYVAATKKQEVKDQMVDVLYQIESTNPNFKKKIIPQGTQLMYQYMRNFPIGETEFWPTFSYMCYEDLSALSSQDNTIVIRSSSKNLCYDKYSFLENITVRFKTDYKVIKNNADEVNENEYIWNINRTNKDNKPILIEVKYDEKKVMTNPNNTSSKKENNLSMIIMTVIIILSVAALIVYIIRKVKKSNEFS